MSFERKRTVFLLTFEDPELTGLEVRCSSASVRSMREIMQLAREAQGAEDAGGDPEKAFELFGKFAPYLTSWNLTDGGMPVPATAEGLDDQDFGFALSIIMAWLGGMTGGGSDPLDRPSVDGTRRLVESIPMDVLSPSLVS